MQLEPLEVEHSIGAAGPDEDLDPLDLSFLEPPEHDAIQLCPDVASGFPAQPYAAQGKHTIFVDRCSGRHI